MFRDTLVPKPDRILKYAAPGFINHHTVLICRKCYAPDNILGLLETPGGHYQDIERITQPPQGIIDSHSFFHYVINGTFQDKDVYIAVGCHLSRGSRAK